MEDDVKTLAGKTHRARLGGEWQVASAIVSRTARAIKCRAADDLLTAAEGHPVLEAARLRLWQMPTPELIGLTVGTDPLWDCAIAFWYVLGTIRAPAACASAVASHRLPSRACAKPGFQSPFSQSRLRVSGSCGTR
jgi:hypothetical protein